MTQIDVHGMHKGDMCALAGVGSRNLCTGDMCPIRCLGGREDKCSFQNKDEVLLGRICQVTY